MLQQTVALMDSSIFKKVKSVGGRQRPCPQKSSYKTKSILRTPTFHVKGLGHNYYQGFNCVFMYSGIRASDAISLLGELLKYIKFISIFQDYSTVFLLIAFVI